MPKYLQIFFPRLSENFSFTSYFFKNARELQMIKFSEKQIKFVLQALLKNNAFEVRSNLGVCLALNINLTEEEALTILKLTEDENSNGSWPSQKLKCISLISWTNYCTQNLEIKYKKFSCKCFQTT